MSESLLPVFKSIAEDRTHGAAQLYQKTLKAFKRNSRKFKSLDDLLEVVRLLVNGQPAMAPILNLCIETYNVCEKSRIDYLSEFVEMKIQYEHVSEITFCDNLKQKYHDNKDNTWVTFSYSSSFLKGLNCLNSQTPLKARILVPESRPGSEGLRLFKKLKDLMIPTEAISDTAILDIMANANFDRIIIGCDALTDKSFVNKSGTQALLKLAEIVGKPVDIWTQENKLIHPNLFKYLDIPYNQSKDIKSPHVSPDEINQPLFAYADTGLVDCIITETREYSKEEIVNYCNKLPILSSDILNLIFIDQQKPF